VAKNEKPGKTLALIAHDGRKEVLIAFAAIHRELLGRFRLIGTATTARLVSEQTGLPIEAMLSGPLGGDVQIAARVATGDVQAVIFLIDPLNAHPHEPDIQAILRVCNVHNVPLATNVATAELLVTAGTV
jgi:methylglyoxal synthase